MPVRRRSAPGCDTVTRDRYLYTSAQCVWHDGRVTTTPDLRAAVGQATTAPGDAGLARRQSGARAVYDLLRGRIIDGSLAPDARLTEPVLSAELGVSRTPVREALRLLQAEALVVELPTGGVRVAPLDVADARTS